MIATTLHSLLNIQLSPYNPIIYNESSIIIFSDPEDIAPPKLVRHLPLLQICLKYMYSTPCLPHPTPPPPAPLPPTKFGMSAVFSFSKDN